MQNTNSPASRLHPIIWIAAGAVTLFSIVGISKQMGWIGNSAAPAVEEPVELGAASAPVVPPVAEKKPAPAPAKQASAERSTPPSKVAERNRIEERREARRAERREERLNTTPLPTQPASQALACRDCGVVESVTTTQVPVAASGVGAVGGAVVGGALGNQVGEGSGKTAATVVGAILGGLGGHKVEQNVRTKTEYSINVRMADGSNQSFRSETQPLWRQGDRVQIRNGVVEPLDTSRGQRAEQL